MKSSTRTTIIHLVPFKVLYEVHDVKSFQEEGHFVPCLREVNADGEETRQPRKWKGTKVHCLTLLGPDGEPATAKDCRGKEVSMCRAVSDSRADAERRLSDIIRETFFSQKTALDVVSFNAEQLRKSVDERTRLVNNLLSRDRRDELAEVLGESVAAIEELQRAEADPAMRADVESKIGALP